MRRFREGQRAILLVAHHYLRMERARTARRRRSGPAITSNNVRRLQLFEAIGQPHRSRKRAYSSREVARGRNLPGVGFNRYRQ